MSRITLRRALALGGVLALGAAGGAAATTAIYQAGTPKRVVLVQAKNPAGARGRTLILQRVAIPGATPLAAHTHQGTQIAAITSGTLRYTVLEGRPVRVVHTPAGADAPVFVRAIEPGQTYDVKAGYSVIEPAGTAHAVESVGEARVVIYVASLFVNGAPLSDPYPAGRIPGPGAGRVSLAP